MDQPIELPIPDYDHLPLGSLESRIRSLDEPDVRVLLDHEREHGNRLPVTNLLEQRIRMLEGGTEPSAGSTDQGSVPEVQPAATDPSKASPQTSGPPVNPPSQGVPTNPAQPRG